jgi:periplasmic protein TonB
MKTEEGSYLQQWDEMVFQNRNKDYGAYSIRKVYPKHVMVGSIIAITLVFLIIIFPIVRAYFKGYDVDLLMNSGTGTPRLELTPPPPIDKNIPVKLVAPPSFKEPVKLLPPKIVTEEVEQEVPTVEEIKKNEVIPLTTENTNEGTFDGLASGEGEDKNIYDFAEQMPAYIGGPSAMNEFISTTIRYPASAQRMRLSGTVFVGFIVNADGTISDVHAVKGFSGDCDKEAERVVRSMPPWEPGRQDGKPVKVKFVVPIRFKLGA